MGLLSWVVIGLVVGIGAVVSQRDRGAEAVAVALCGGLVGALAGGLLYSLFRWGALGELRLGSAVLALLGAGLFVAGARGVRRLPP